MPNIDLYGETIEEFRQLLADAFEYELMEAEKRTLQVVKRAVSSSVHNTVREKVKSGNLLTCPYGLVGADATSRKNGYVDIGIELSLFTGMKKQRGQIISDVKYWEDVFQRLNTIGIDGFGSLYLKRKGRPQKSYLTQPKILSTGEALPSTHVVQISYTMEIPTEMIPEIYERHRHLITA